MEFNKIKRNAFDPTGASSVLSVEALIDNFDEVVRKEWPFKHMNPGDEVNISLADWPKAYNALHARMYTTRQKFKFARFKTHVCVRCITARPEGALKPQEGGKNRVWGFSKCEVMGQPILVALEDYNAAKNAMRQIERRLGFKFRHKAAKDGAIFQRIA